MVAALNIFFCGGSAGLFRYSVGGFHEVAEWCRRDT